MDFLLVHHMGNTQDDLPADYQSGNANDKDVGHEYTTEMVSLEDLLYIRIVAYCI